MPSFQDSAVIFFIALLLFGPKKLPELARYVGKMMNEFRRASNEFRNQMQDEFRQIEQTEQQEKIKAIEAAAPLNAALVANIPDPEHPHLQPVATEESLLSLESGSDEPYTAVHSVDVPSTLAPQAVSETVFAAPAPIASNGDLHMMPPSTGLPVARSANASVGALFDSIPHVPAPAPVQPNGHDTHEVSSHG